MLKRFLSTSLYLFLVIITSQKLAFSDVASLQSNYVAGEANIVTHLNNDRTTLTNSVNNVQGCQTGSVQSAGQIKGATVCDENIYDDASPHLRTYEGAACEFVYTGLLPTTSSSLVGNIPPGTAYPKGYRVIKNSSTANLFGANLWTYVDIDKNGTLVYTTQTIGGTTPSVATNAIRLARVSTDSSTIVSVQDLRKTNCANGPFSAISDSAGEANLANLFSTGTPVRRFSEAGITPQGMAQGAFVSFDTTATFKVTAGSLYINGKYRYVSSDITVTTANDNPLSGGSGLDTGTVTGGPQKYCIYGVADQDANPAYSITYSTNCASPSGVTNSRLIGSIFTDATNLFTSRDVVTVHGISDYEIPFAWIRMEGNAGAPRIDRSFNISSLTENATGAWTVVFNSNPASADFVMVGACGSGGSAFGNFWFTGGTITATSAKFFCSNTAPALVTTPDVFAEFTGDNRK